LRARAARSRSRPCRSQLYDGFIRKFEAKLSQLQLVLVVVAIAAQYYPSRPPVLPELEHAEAFLSSFLDKKDKLGADAFLVLQMELLSLRLKRSAVSTAPAALDGSKKDLDAGLDALAALPDGTDPVVTATVHRVGAEYYKLRGPANLFYDSALLYLGHTPVEALSLEARAGMALDVATAALVGEGIYNFGEVNALPILQSLAGTPNAWMIDLLRVFQTGDLTAFAALSTARAADIARVPALVSHSSVVREKITLLRLMELSASRPAHGRALSFADVAASCTVGVDAVESLAMRAISLGLLKGTLDEVDQVSMTQQGMPIVHAVADPPAPTPHPQIFHVTFVAPRVLSIDQLRTLKGSVDEWRVKARQTLAFLHTNTQELLA